MSGIGNTKNLGKPLTGTTQYGNIDTFNSTDITSDTIIVNDITVNGNVINGFYNAVIIENSFINNTPIGQGGADVGYFTLLQTGSSGIGYDAYFYANGSNNYLHWNPITNNLELNAGLYVRDGATLGSVNIAHVTLTTVTVSNAMITGGATINNAFLPTSTLSNTRITNIVATNATVSHVNLTNLTTTNLITTNETVSTLNATHTIVTNATVSTLNTTNLVATNETVSTLNATNLVATNETVSTLNATNLVATNETVSTLNTTNLVATNETVTNLVATNATVSHVNLINLTTINLIVTNETVSNMDVIHLNTTNATVTHLNVTNETVSNVFAVNETVTNSNVTNQTVANLVGVAMTTGTIYLDGSFNYVENGTFGYTTSTGSTIAWFSTTGSTTFSTSVYAENWIASRAGFVTASDQRLKCNVSPLMNSFPLEQFQVMEYEWIDQKRIGKQFGLIAQQVEDVAPHLVHTQGGFIPNIMQTLRVSTLSQRLNFPDGTLIQVYNSDMGKMILSVEQQRVNTDSLPPDAMVFVYGTFVHDLKHVDYSGIIPLLIKGYQELSERLYLLENHEK